MTIEELDSKLEGGTETQTFEVKGPCDWNVKSFAKDILAMANVQEGGDIIIGIENGSFARSGVSPAHKASYNLETMKDQMAAYADPHVNFTTGTIPDTVNNKEYIFIRVYPFDDIPVICKIENEDVHRGIVYYRNKNRRVESAPVSNSYDMRDIITTAAVKMKQRLRQAGLVAADVVDVAAQTKKKLDDELDGL